MTDTETQLARDKALAQEQAVELRRLRDSNNRLSARLDNVRHFDQRRLMSSIAAQQGVDRGILGGLPRNIHGLK